MFEFIAGMVHFLIIKDIFGTRDECLRKGFAVGQKQKYIRDGGIQRGPIVIEENGWYKAYLPR